MYPLAGAKAVTANPDFPSLETDVLAYWDADGTFQASVDARDAGADGANEFVFYDGPPFANGLPHYGHLLTGYVKDVVPRYQTMRGRRVERRFGWDCHGLPAEVEAEHQLGIKHKIEIEEMGVAEFNAACRASVLQYTSDWEAYVTRQARWVDFANDYKTLDLDYMESVMWAFKTLWDKGLIYEGYRVLWYCWRCETPLSNTETRMDDVYRARQDPAVTVAFRLTAPGLRPRRGEALAWTTTPWTLPSNLAWRSGPTSTTCWSRRRRGRGERFVLAAARLDAYAKELPNPLVVRQIRAAHELLGLSYTPVFDFFVGRPNAHRMLSADYVTTTDGTGIVHIAPAFGEEDKVVTDAAGIEVVNPVDSQGRFTCAGAAVRGDAGVRRESVHHHRPAGLRRAAPSGDLRPLLPALLALRLAADPACGVVLVRRGEHVQGPDGRAEPAGQLDARRTSSDGQFGKWLANARDWSISRNRFWGSPIPVWTSDDPAYPRIDVYGSLDDLERDFGVRPTDLHRPFVDDLTRPNPDDPTGRSTMRRVPEVLDCWFESGSMPYAQVHYPFENREWFEHHYPGDFIVEYNGQTRGWFYTLHVLATALFDRPAFRSCIAHGIVLGDDGRQDEQVTQELPGRQRGVRPRRPRRHALVPDEFADPARWRPDRHRGRHPRGCPAGRASAVERVVLPVAVRQRGRRSVGESRRRAARVSWGADDRLR